MSNGFWNGAGQLGRMSRPGPSVSRINYSNGTGIRWMWCVETACCVYVWWIVIDLVRSLTWN